MFLGSNIKFLRNRKGLTQEAFANDIGITRSTLNNYENTNVLNPTAELLVSFSKYFNVSVDVILKTDLTQLSEKAMEELEKGYDVFTTGTKLRVLATTVDCHNNENVELVSIKAKAGYVNGYGDLEYVKKLPVFQLPFLSREKKYRTFQITGDSMLPIPDKSYVIGEYVQNLNELKDGTACIVITVDDGVVFKIVTNLIKESKSLLLSSLNPLFEPFEVVINKIKEVWKFTHFISSELPEPVVSNDAIVSTVLKLQKEVKKLQK